MCFLAKVSVVILSEDFAGYYLHGRNRMPFADTSMSDINKELQKKWQLLFVSFWDPEVFLSRFTHKINSKTR